MSESVSLPEGFQASAVHAGLQPDGALDLGLIVADAACRATAVFTQNLLRGAHIPVCHDHLRQSNNMVRAVLVNAGNANCATGAAGEEDARTICRSLAEILDCPEEQVLFMSTGVIGKRLPVAKIQGALPALKDELAADGLDDFATAILTTDTRTKTATAAATAEDGKTVQVTGIAKGSGMVHPDLATMLAFLITDGHSTRNLNMTLRNVVDDSFHCMTVDGDTSPNDTVLLWSTERHWVRPVRDAQGLERSDDLDDALLHVAQDLSRQIAADGEGATRLVTVQVRGALSAEDAAHVGRFIATSALVKTAIHGGDPNWGRILSAACTAGVNLQFENLRVWIGESELYADGKPHPENEAAASQHLKNDKEVTVGVDLGAGPYDADVWTCDLSADYVGINAHYRT
ncbi:MAG: bifunctional glutamate N-acetyltransferase/amino-acid acetyltransferase ArgJ [Planctomycetota bacterium]|jgi:glutamate N-acetyltransferase/amino-acid N-acetyltransferase